VGGLRSDPATCMHKSDCTAYRDRHVNGQVETVQETPNLPVVLRAVVRALVGDMAKRMRDYRVMRALEGQRLANDLFRTRCTRGLSLGPFGAHSWWVVVIYGGDQNRLDGFEDRPALFDDVLTVC
jgi:hypothetical protein